jgi:hypothetical protein
LRFVNRHHTSAFVVLPLSRCLYSSVPACVTSPRVALLSRLMSTRSARDVRAGGAGSVSARCAGAPLGSFSSTFAARETTTGVEKRRARHDNMNIEHAGHLSTFILTPEPRTVDPLERTGYGRGVRGSRLMCGEANRGYPTTASARLWCLPVCCMHCRLWTLCRESYIR